MTEGLDNGPNLFSEGDCGRQAINVDFQSDAVLQSDNVKFTVHIKSYIIPPAPPKPDFDASREKLQKLGEGEGSMTEEEFAKMKQELEAENLVIFKKTIAIRTPPSSYKGLPSFRFDFFS
uniref:Uncharacterized protein n=1 Tax=Balaenoptera musculus TaxID=9771 RepID=A0A8C0CYB9_BALMU